MVVFLIKAAVLGVFAWWLHSVSYMLYLGRRVDYLNRVNPTRHEQFARVVNWSTALMILAAGGSHLIVREQIGGASGLLFYFHVTCAVLFVLSLWFMQCYTGVADPRNHKRIAWFWLIPTFIGTAITGPILVIRM